jgi:hypothetical protein
MMKLTKQNQNKGVYAISVRWWSKRNRW